MPTTQGGYIKYTYWLTTAERIKWVEELGGMGVRVRPAKSVMCTALDAFNRASYVSGPVWDKICFRQGSWYRASRWAGMELLVLSFPLRSLQDRLNTMIRQCSFRPPRYATTVEMEKLISSRIYTASRPPQWELVPHQERQRWIRWLQKRGVNATFEEIFLAHRANHANFMDPLLYTVQDGSIVPYSIAPSSHLCSCCLEMFNVVGDDFRRKLVSPCLGSLMFADLSQDAYYEVISPS